MAVRQRGQYSRSYCNEMAQRGLPDSQKISLQGRGSSCEEETANMRKVEKGKARLFGLCITCELFAGKDSKPGKHCKGKGWCVK